MDAREQALPKVIPAINYVWVGPPATKSGLEQPGSDIAYVVEMMKSCKNPANYYCLDQHVKHYQELFAKYGVQVNVKSIESFLEEMTRNHDADMSRYAEKMLEIMKIQLGPARNEIRDRVFFKDAFTFFLLAAQGGYTLDTNLRIVDSVNTFTLPAHKEFKAPYNYISTQPTLDVFIMYSPQDNREQPTKMISHYLSHWDDAQKELFSSTDDIIRISRFHKIMSQLSNDALVAGMNPTQNHESDMRLDPAWQFTALRPDEFSLPAGAVHAVKIEGLPLIKIFSNSHKPEHEIKKHILARITKYKNEHPQFAILKMPLIALLDQQRARYDSLDAGKSMDIMTVNRKLHTMLEVFTSLDQIAVAESEKKPGFMSFLWMKPTNKISPRIGELYAKAVKIATESMAELGQVNQQEFKELFAQYTGGVQSAVKPVSGGQLSRK